MSGTSPKDPMSKDAAARIQSAEAHKTGGDVGKGIYIYTQLQAHVLVSLLRCYCEMHRCQPRRARAHKVLILDRKKNSTYNCRRYRILQGLKQVIAACHCSGEGMVVHNTLKIFTNPEAQQRTLAVAWHHQLPDSV